jgi:hypothetical protein
LRNVVLVILLACACALGSALAAFAQAPDPGATTDSTTTDPTAEPAQGELQKLIDRYRHRAWHWQRVMGRPVTLTLSSPPPDPVEKIRVWRRIAVHAQARALHPPHLREWLCIHRFEGSWSDPNAPYYGGLQMDVGFQQAYGRDLLARKGTANHWTPLEQIWVAERAYTSGRGFYPWPNTARACGLL